MNGRREKISYYLNSRGNMISKEVFGHLCLSVYIGLWSIYCYEYSISTGSVDPLDNALTMAFVLIIPAIVGILTGLSMKNIRNKYNKNIITLEDEENGE